MVTVIQVAINHLIVSDIFTKSEKGIIRYNYIWLS